MFKPTEAKTPEEYINLVQDPDRKAEIVKLDALIKKAVPDLKPFILAGMIGYGKFNYKYKSGREGEWGVIALASQKNYISVYICATDGEEYIAEDYKHSLPAKAGKSKLSKVNIGKSCIRFKRISDIDLGVLEEVIKKGARVMKEGKSTIYQN